MARTRSAGAEATMAQASTPPLAPEPANPSALSVQPSAGTDASASIPEVEHTASGVFEVSLEGLGASAQDIEALRRIQALITGKATAVQQEQEARPSSSQAQSPQQQGAAPAHTAPDDVDFNIRQAERFVALLQGQITNTLPQQRPPPHTSHSSTSGRRTGRTGVPAARLAYLAGYASSTGSVEAVEGCIRRAEHRTPTGTRA
jgi:hypothetical protein